MGGRRPPWKISGWTPVHLRPPTLAALHILVKNEAFAVSNKAKGRAATSIVKSMYM